MKKESKITKEEMHKAWDCDHESIVADAIGRMQRNDIPIQEMHKALKYWYGYTIKKKLIDFDKLAVDVHMGLSESEEFLTAKTYLELVAGRKL